MEEGNYMSALPNQPHWMVMAHTDCQLDGTQDHPGDKAQDPSVRECLVYVNWGGKTHPEYGWHRGWGPGLNGEEKVSRTPDSSPSAS